jgi:pantothenate kinase-related protein Tda10
MAGIRSGNPAISTRPVAFRPHLTVGLAFSHRIVLPHNVLNQICQEFPRFDKAKKRGGKTSKMPLYKRPEESYTITFQNAFK